jgi:hypothetical protein
MVFIAKYITRKGGNRRETAMRKWKEGAVVRIHVASCEAETLTRRLAFLHLGKSFLH